MNDIFNFSRFCKWFRRDLTTAWKKYGVTFLVAGTLPVSFYLIGQIISLFSPGENIFGDPDHAFQLLAALIAMAVVCLGFSAKVYGNITDRRAGSNMLMLPASTLEKFLSMVLVTCVVLPLCLAVLVFGTDAIMSSVFPVYGNGTNLFSLVKNTGRPILDDLHCDTISASWIPLICVSWIETILLFLLGALWFKKSKVSKTILVMLVLSVILYFTQPLFINENSVNALREVLSSGDAGSAAAYCFKMNLYATLKYTGKITVFLALIYFRLRSIKH